MIVIVEKY